MLVPLILNVPEEVHQWYSLLAYTLGWNLEDIVLQSITDAKNRRVYVDKLSDDDVLRLADSMMETSQSQRMTELFGLRDERPLSETENAKMEQLLNLYNLGNLLKVQGIAEAVHRGLRQPSAS